MKTHKMIYPYGDFIAICFKKETDWRNSNHSRIYSHDVHIYRNNGTHFTIVGKQEGFELLNATIHYVIKSIIDSFSSKIILN